MDFMDSINIDKFQDYLEAVRYPASRMSIINAARQKSAPSDVMAMLKELPDKKFSNYDEVSHQLNSLILDQRRIGPR